MLRTWVRVLRWYLLPSAPKRPCSVMASWETMAVTLMVSVGDTALRTENWSRGASLVTTRAGGCRAAWGEGCAMVTSLVGDGGRALPLPSSFIFLLVGFSLVVGGFSSGLGAGFDCCSIHSLKTRSHDSPLSRRNCSIFALITSLVNAGPAASPLMMLGALGEMGADESKLSPLSNEMTFGA